MKRMKKFVKLIIFLVIFLGVFQVIISNQLSTLGSELLLIEKETGRLRDENGRLKQKIASSSSLSTITLKAQRFGFEKKAEFFYLETQIPVALENLK